MILFVVESVLNGLGIPHTRGGDPVLTQQSGNSHKYSPHRGDSSRLSDILSLDIIHRQTSFAWRLIYTRLLSYDFCSKLVHLLPFFGKQKSIQLNAECLITTGFAPITWLPAHVFHLNIQVPYRHFIYHSFRSLNTVVLCRALFSFINYVFLLLFHWFIIFSIKADSSLLTFLVPFSACTYRILHTWEWSPIN